MTSQRVSLTRGLICGGLLALISGIATSALASASDYQVDFGPFVGNGASSTGDKVRNTSGFTLALDRSWRLTDSGLLLGPRLELSNAFVNARGGSSGTEAISNYDNRIVAAGFLLTQQVGNRGTLFQSVYLAAVAGRGVSKLTVDDSTSATFDQNLYSNINGNYYATELGTFMPLKGNFGVNIAFLGTVYQANQANATGSYNGNQLMPDGSLSLLAGAHNPNDGSLPASVQMRTYAMKVGLSLGF